MSIPYAYHSYNYGQYNEMVHNTIVSIDDEIWEQSDRTPATKVAIDNYWDKLHMVANGNHELFLFLADAFRSIGKKLFKKTKQQKGPFYEY